MHTDSHLVAIENKIASLARRHSVWKPDYSTNPTNAGLLQALHVEWTAHFLAAAATLTDLYRELAAWKSSDQSGSGFSDKLFELGCQDLHSLADALMVDNLDVILRLGASIAESAAKLTGVHWVVFAFETKGILNKLREVVHADDHRLNTLDEPLKVFDASAQTLLVLSLWAEAKIGSITGRYQSGSSPQSWRRAVGNRVASARMSLIEEIGGLVLQVGFPSDGLWPQAFREA